MSAREPAIALHFRRRADDLFGAARDLAHLDGAALESYWPAVGLLAVHGCIALADAVLVAVEGMEGGGQNHKEAAQRLRKWCSARAIEAQGITHFEWLLGKKNHFSYDARTVRDDELKQAKIKMDQFFAWAFQQFPVVAQLRESSDA